MPSKEDVIAYLRALTNEDLAQVFYEAMEPRNDRKTNSEVDFWNHIYVIAVADHSFGEPAELAVLASAHESSIELPPAWKARGSNQSGKCDTCGTFIVSTAKVAKCPVCSSEVECT